MAEFTMEIAGRRARVRSLFESTPAYFRAYLSQEPPHFSVTVTAEDLAFEQQELYEEALREGFRVRHFTDPFLERAAIQRRFAEELLRFDTLMLHGSTVAVDGKAYLFTARSGTGKSTHTRLWREIFGQRAVMVNDDKPFLRVTETQVIAYGSPWSGKHGLDSNIAAPLKCICLLERGSENRIWKACPQELMDILLHESYCPMDENHRPGYRKLVQALAEKTPLWHMTCAKDPQAAAVAFDAMHHAGD